MTNIICAKYLYPNTIVLGLRISLLMGCLSFYNLHVLFILNTLGIVGVINCQFISELSIRNPTSISKNNKYINLNKKVVLYTYIIIM